MDKLVVLDLGCWPRAAKVLDDPHKGRSTVLSYLPDKRMLLTGHFAIPAKPPEILERPKRGRECGSLEIDAGFVGGWPSDSAGSEGLAHRSGSRLFPGRGRA